MEDEGGQGGPGIFIGVEVGGFFFLRGAVIRRRTSGRTRATARVARTLYGTDAVVAVAQLGCCPGDGVGMGECAAFEGVLIEFFAALYDGVLKILPDGGCAVQG